MLCCDIGRYEVAVVYGLVGDGGLWVMVMVMVALMCDGVRLMCGVVLVVRVIVCLSGFGMLFLTLSVEIADRDAASTSRSNLEGGLAT